MRLHSFESRLLFYMLSPLGVLLLTKLVSWFRRDRSVERELSERLSASGKRVTRRQHLSVGLRQSTYKFLPHALRLSFFAFPVVSSLAFKAFRCDDLNTEDEPKTVGVMKADFSVECWDEDGGFTPEYQRIRSLAALAIFLYPVCVPLAYIALFWRVRHAFWRQEPTTLSTSIKFLTEEFDATFYFWELARRARAAASALRLPSRHLRRRTCGRLRCSRSCFS